MLPPVSPFPPRRPPDPQLTQQTKVCNNENPTHNLPPSNSNGYSVLQSSPPSLSRKDEKKIHVDPFSDPHESKHAHVEIDAYGGIEWYTPFNHFSLEITLIHAIVIHRSMYYYLLLYNFIPSIQSEPIITWIIRMCDPVYNPLSDFNAELLLVHFSDNFKLLDVHLYERVQIKHSLNFSGAY